MITIKSTWRRGEAKGFVSCGFLGATLIAFLKNPETLDLINYIQHTCIAPKPCSQNEDHQNDKKVEGHHPPPPNDSPWFVGFLSLILARFGCPESDEVGNTRNDECGEAHEQGPNHRIERSKEWERKSQKPKQETNRQSSQHSVNVWWLMHTQQFLPHEVEGHHVQSKCHRLVDDHENDASATSVGWRKHSKCIVLM